MKRIFPVLLSLVLVFSLIAVPVHAMESISFYGEDYISILDYYAHPVYIPEGTYFLKIDDGKNTRMSTSVFTVSYSPVEYEGYEILMCSVPIDPLSSHFSGVNCMFTSLELFCLENDGQFFTCVMLCNSDEDIAHALIDSFTYSFVPVDLSYFSGQTLAFNSSSFTSYQGMPCFSFAIPAGEYVIFLPNYGMAISDPFVIDYNLTDDYGNVGCSVPVNFPSLGSANFYFWRPFDDASLSIVRYGAPHSEYDVTMRGSESVFLMPVKSATPSLSGIVDSGMMSGVLDQVVSILPVVLVVLIGFIAVRKGISFLRGFLAGS